MFQSGTPHDAATDARCDADEGDLQHR